ncbi:hypothetical protein [Lentzea sp. NPDC004782]|uniref:hypothetical protein n=1 Tax=Lentzea sp. NPDC004782 TaxID=3154458 RepID=UPI0033B081F1
MPWALAAKAARNTTSSPAVQPVRTRASTDVSVEVISGRAAAHLAIGAAVEAAAPPEVAATGNNAAATDLTLEKLCRAAAFLT